MRMWRKAPIRELAKLATILARPDMRGRTYWRRLFGTDRWTVLLLTQSRRREGEAPEYAGAPQVRINPKWLAKTGAELSGEALLHLRMIERMQAFAQGDPIRPYAAAAVAADLCVEMIRDGWTLNPTEGDTA